MIKNTLNVNHKLIDIDINTVQLKVLLKLYPQYLESNIVIACC